MPGEHDAAAVAQRIAGTPGGFIRCRGKQQEAVVLTDGRPFLMPAHRAGRQVDDILWNIGLGGDDRNRRQVGSPAREDSAMPLGARGPGRPDFLGA
jgi:hypothetical protein